MKDRHPTPGMRQYHVPSYRLHHVLKAIEHPKPRKERLLDSMAEWALRWRKWCNAIFGERP